ncbi:MAG: transglutaminase-like cysteine peptidase [Arcobacteraceae bacterium]|jgi:predicted transglutaminase-like cysteine proteinase|nr:transglutaminase-like cysteine peptidase [Arcobacteraceae bacterium]
MKHITLLILLLCSALLSKELLLTQKDLKRIEQLPQSHFILNRFEAFYLMRQKVKPLNLMQKLVHVNLFYNQSLPIHDENKYSSDDYWATRKEFIINGKGDCEDYAIAKYLTLIEVGIPKENLYLAIVQVKEHTTYHMVLLYHEVSSDTLYVLDNLSFRVLPLHKRVDLIPLVAFNEFESRELKAQTLGKVVKIDWGKIDKWKELLTRIYSKNE